MAKYEYGWADVVKGSFIAPIMNMRYDSSKKMAMTYINKDYSCKKCYFVDEKDPMVKLNVGDFCIEANTIDGETINLKLSKIVYLNKGDDRYSNKKIILERSVPIHKIPRFTDSKLDKAVIQTCKQLFDDTVPLYVEYVS